LGFPKCASRWLVTPRMPQRTRADASDLERYLYSCVGLKDRRANRLSVPKHTFKDFRIPKIWEQNGNKTRLFMALFGSAASAKATESTGFMERAMGIEPTSEAWEASILPLYDARSSFLIVLRNWFSVQCSGGSAVRSWPVFWTPQSVCHLHFIAHNCALTTASVLLYSSLSRLRFSARSQISALHRYVGVGVD
jgi:hypothetical protein